MRPGAAPVLIALVAVLLGGCAAPTPSAHSRGWLEVRTKNFTIASRLDEQETIGLAERLGLFRAVVARFTNIERLEPRVPTYIYVFESSLSFSPFRSDKAVLGYFLPGLRANHATVLKGGGLDASSILYHEYTHFLVNNEHDLAYPRWFNEGFAEFMGSIRVEEDVLLYGAVAEERVQSLQFGSWMPIRRVLTAERFHKWTTADKSMFYAEAWALVHYLMFSGGEGDFSRRMTTYIRALSSGSAPEQAFEQAFEVSARRLDANLRKYLSRRLKYYKIPMSRFGAAEEPVARPMSASEIAIRLGQLALSLGDGPLAQGYFEAALVEEPAQPRALAGLGDAHKFQGHWDQAEPLFRRAVELGPDSALNELDYAEYFHDRARAMEEQDERQRLLREARRHYVASYKLDPGLAETYALYGASYLMEGEPVEKGLATLEHAHALLPHREIKILLATAYVKLGRSDGARALLQAVLVQSHAGRLAASAQRLLERIDRDAESPVPAAE